MNFVMKNEGENMKPQRAQTPDFSAFLCVLCGQVLTIRFVRLGGGHDCQMH